MEAIVTIAFITAMFGNIWLLLRAGPSLGRALAGPQPITDTPSRPPAEVIHLADWQRPRTRHARPARLRQAA